jgi:hypothetical protein
VLHVLHFEDIIKFSEDRKIKCNAISKQVCFHDEIEI